MAGDTTIQLQSLTPAAFAPFGDVMEVNNSNDHFPINYGLTERHHRLADIDVADEGGSAVINIFRSKPVTLPFKIKIMERHPLGSQAFTMLSGQPYISVVAPKGEFNADNMQAFLVQPNQSINYHKGTWHHYCLCLNAVCDLLVVDRKGPGQNCDEEKIDSSQIIYIDF